MSRSTDQEIIEQIKAGDINSYTLLIDRYKHMVYTLAVRLLKIREDAEEVSQDIFLRAFRSLATYRGDAKFSTWLYKIAYYRCLDHIRKVSVHRMPSIDSLPEYVPTGFTDRNMEAMELAERQKLVREAIEELPADDSCIVTLFYLEELSLKEIAEITGHTTNSVKVKLHRSRRRLLDILKQKLEPEIIETYEGRSAK